MCISDVIKSECKPNETLIDEQKHTIWKVMRKSALEVIVSWRIKRQQLNKVSTPCLDDHQFKKEELETVGALSKVCSQIVLKCLCWARIGRLDILWSANLLEQSQNGQELVTDSQLVLIACIHHTHDHRQCCHSFADSDYFRILTLLRILKTLNRPRGEFCASSENLTFVPKDWMCKKQT